VKTAIQLHLVPKDEEEQDSWEATVQIFSLM